MSLKVFANKLSDFAHRTVSALNGCVKKLVDLFRIDFLAGDCATVIDNLSNNSLESRFFVVLKQFLETSLLGADRGSNFIQKEATLLENRCAHFFVASIELLSDFNQIPFHHVYNFDDVKEGLRELPRCSRCHVC